MLQQSISGVQHLHHRTSSLGRSIIQMLGPLLTLGLMVERTYFKTTGGKREVALTHLLCRFGLVIRISQAGGIRSRPYYIGSIGALHYPLQCTGLKSLSRHNITSTNVPA
uniref:Uncharacterized protein n=1 Tax=Picea glauca TaxID=3330 RepID=A0A101LZ76_PICGL|nr:hypothetical protein ABT39_MTgene5053 [Picea glauca]